MYSVPRNYFFDGHKHCALQEVVIHCKHHIYRYSVCNLINDKTEIYQLPYSLQIFKCFKLGDFKIILPMKNETVLQLFNFYCTL